MLSQVHSVVPGAPPCVAHLWHTPVRYTYVALGDTFPSVSLESPACKILGKGAVDHGRVAFPSQVCFPLDGLDIALLDVVRLPCQLPRRRVRVLPLWLPITPPGEESLELRPSRGEVCSELGAE